MTINRTTLLDLPLPVTGTESGTWGDIVNNGLSEYIDISVAGSLSLSADSDTNLSSTEGNAAGTNIGSTTAQYAILRCTGARTATRNINAPAWAISGGTLTNYSKIYIVVNETTGSQNIVLRATDSATPTYTTGVTIVPGERAVCAWNGSDFVKVGGAAGGSTTQVQYNNAGVFGGISNATTDGTTLSMTSPKVITGINDTNGNELLKVTATASAVNELTLANAATGGNPVLSATGGDTNIGITLTPKGTGGVVFPAGAVGTPAITTTGDTNTGVFFPAADTIAFAEGGAEAMRIDSSGNLLVGTTAAIGAADRLSVSGGNLTVQRTTIQTTLGDNGTSVGYVGTISNNDFMFLTNSTERMRITSAGNVGIGTSSPASTIKLDIANASTNNLIRISRSGVSGDSSRIIFDAPDSSNVTYQLVNIAAVGDGADNGAFLVTTRTSGTMTEKMRLNSNGALVLAGGTTTANGVGITFPATQSASTDANTLDDYEEGTWSLTVTAGSGSFTSITSTAGYYTKVGNLVSAYGRIKIGTNGTAATDVRVSGLPFSSASGNTRYAGSGLEGDQVGFSLNAFILQSTNLIYLQKYDGTYPGGTSYGLDFTITYRT